MTYAVTPMQAFWRLYRIQFYAFGAVTLVMAVFLAGSSWANLALISRGVETEGTVTVLNYSTQVCRGDSCPGGVRDGQTYYSVNRVYDFTTADGVAGNFQRTGTQSAVPVVGSRNAASIIYLPDNPQTARVGTRASLMRDIQVFLGLTGLGLAVLVGLAAWIALDVRRTFALVRTGKPRRGTVFQGEGGQSFNSTFQWKLSNGRVGVSLPLAKGEQLPRSGTRITVLDDGKRSAWPGQIAPETNTDTFEGIKAPSPASS
jgi:hypothetical protein